MIALLASDLVSLTQQGENRVIQQNKNQKAVHTRELERGGTYFFFNKS